MPIIWVSDLADKIERDLFQSIAVSVLLYGSTLRPLTKRMEKMQNGNYPRILRAILNKSWTQHPTKNICTATYLLSYLPTKHCRWSKDKLIDSISFWIPSQGHAWVGWLISLYINFVRTLDVIYRTCQKRFKEIRAMRTFWWGKCQWWLRPYKIFQFL